MRQTRSLVHSWQDMDEFPLRYMGITPIATCHWQWIANILAASGYGEYWERLGLAWGCRWPGSGVLFGSADWPVVAHQAFGADVDVLTFPEAADARAEELSLTAAGLPFVVEVDEFYLPPGSADPGHIVHAVLVLERTPGYVRLVDSRVSARVVQMDASRYQRMRSSACWGRVQPHKLYVIRQGPSADPTPAELLAEVRQHLARGQQQSQQALRRYIADMRQSGDPIDVCRVAGERYQAALLFGYFAEAGLPRMTDIQAQLSGLSDTWYLVHMLASHQRGREPRSRERQLRLLERLELTEAAIVEAILS
jgi:hypothetical protein